MATKQQAEGTSKAKRRSIAQKIGRQGELIFEAWVTAGNFSANKLQDDYGVDFVCQQLLPTGRGSEEVSGLCAFVQVRATSTVKKPRIGMDREDVETALRQTGVFCLAGVHMPTGQVFFRWLDIPLLEEWAEFLKSDRGSITLRLDRMRTDVDRFSTDLALLSRPAQRAKFAQARARLDLEAAMPGSLLRTNTGAKGDWATVTVPNLLSIVGATADQHEALATAMFRPVAFDVSFREVLARHTPHKALLSVHDLVDGPVFVAGGAEEEVLLEIENGTQHVRSAFIMRRVRDERAYIGAAGLVLRITDPRQAAPDAEHAHQLSWEVVREGAMDLLASAQLDFLRMLVPGARLNEAGRPLIAVENFGIERLGRSVQAIERLFTNLALPVSGVKLADLSNDIFAFNLGVLEALAADGPPLFPGFVLGLNDTEAIVETQWRPCRYRVPVTMRMNGCGVLAWVEGDADAYIHEETVRGFRFKTREVMEIGLTELAIAGDGRAAAHFASGWRPLVLAREVPGPDDEPVAEFALQGHYSYSHSASDAAQEESSNP